MTNNKKLAESILADLMNNGPITGVLLKTRIFASKRGDKELLEWVSKELSGYGQEKLPSYRMLGSTLTVIINHPSQGLKQLEFPIELISDNEARMRLSFMPIFCSISEVEMTCEHSKVNNGLVKTRVPVGEYPLLSSTINGQIVNAYRYTTNAAISQIIVGVKTVLIDYLLRIDNEEDINFNNYLNNNPQMITINKVGIMNTGDGEVNAQGATVVVGDNNNISSDKKQELLKILAEVDKIARTQPNPDYDEVSEDIKNELKKDQPNKKFLKRCFQAIPSFLTGIFSGASGSVIGNLISSALGLL